MERDLSMKKLTAFIVAAALAAFSPALAGCRDKTGDPAPDPTNRPETVYEKHPDVNDPLKVGVPEFGFPPMISWDGSVLSGFEMDLIAETAKRLGVSYEIVPLEPGTERERLDDGDIDCAWGNMPDTGKQRLFYGMTDPYIILPQAIAVPEDSAIQSKAEIKSLAAVAFTHAETLAQENKLGTSAAAIHTYKDCGSAFESLAGGVAEAVACDITVALFMQKSGVNLRILDEKAAEARYSVAFSERDEKMREAVNKVLKDIFSEGAASALSQKWLGADYYVK